MGFYGSNFQMHLLTNPKKDIHRQREKKRKKKKLIISNNFQNISNARFSLKVLRVWAMCTPLVIQSRTSAARHLAPTWVRGGGAAP